MSDFGSGVGGGGGSVQSGPRANFGLRLVAALIDWVLMLVISLVVGLLLGNTLGSIVNLLLGLAYYSYLEGSPSGQTLGKRAMNIRVIDFNGGGPIGPTRALIRYLGRIVSAIPCGLGYFWMLWDSEKQTWHDKFAASVVVPTSDYPVAAWPG
ncbi:MAG: RDD family protein [Acidimicrobiales bacterium]